MPFPRIFRVLFGLGIPCRTGDARSEISEADGSDPPFRGPRSISPWREGRRAPGRGASRTWWRVGATAIGASVMLGDARQLDARSVGELVIRRLAAALHQVIQQRYPPEIPLSDARDSLDRRPGQVDDIRRNHWTACLGIRSRHSPHVQSARRPPEPTTRWVVLAAPNDVRTPAEPGFLAARV